MKTSEMLLKLEQKINLLSDKLDAEIWKREHPAPFKYGDKVKVFDNDGITLLFYGKILEVKFEKTCILFDTHYNWKYLIDTGFKIQEQIYGIKKDDQI